MTEKLWVRRTVKLDPHVLATLTPQGFPPQDGYGGDGNRHLPLRPCPRRPVSPLAALMEAAPHDTPHESVPEYAARVDGLRDALDDGGLLTPKERWVLEATFWRGLGVRLIARELGCSKSHVWDVRRAAINKLRARLSSDAAVMGGSEQNTEREHR